MAAVAICVAIASPQTTRAQEPDQEQEQALPAGHPPIGPADILNGQREEDPRDVPPVTDGEDPHAGVPGAPQRRTSLARSEPSSDVPRGSIRVTVTDATGTPAANAEVRVGILGQEGRRDERTGRTAANGRTTFNGLQAGTDQAYRVTVPYQGATYASTPFQLEVNRGQDVTIARLPTTHDAGSVIMIGQIMIELRDDRLRITQQARVMNAGRETYVLPLAGILLKLPRGFVGFQSQPVMTDQRVAEAPDHGMRIFGSVPPGQVTLTWAFDLPLHGSEARFAFDVPWSVYIYRVLCEAPEGLELHVEPGFSRPERLREVEAPMLESGIRRSPGDPAIRRVIVTLQNIPGPGPLRVIALLVAIGLIGGGIYLASRGGQRGAALASARKARKEKLVAEASELEKLFDEGEVGPSYRATRREAIVTELAAILREESAVKPA